MLTSWSHSLISQNNSFGPVQITKCGMSTLLDELNVSRDFMGVLMSMGAPPDLAEDGFGQPIENHYQSGSFSQFKPLIADPR
jgi:hypothetical protein